MRRQAGTQPASASNAPIFVRAAPSSARICCSNARLATIAAAQSGPSSAPLRQSDVQERIFVLGLVPAHGSGDELAASQAAHFRRWEAPIKASGFALE